MQNYIDTKGTSYEIIHSNSYGKITIAKSIDGTNSTFTHLCYGKYGKVKIPDTNSFFSINTFIGWRGRDNICELKANFMDLDFDFYKDKERFLIDYRSGRYSHLPKPTILLASSGLGVWMLWLYKDVPYCRKGKGKKSTVNTSMLKKWKDIQKLLFSKVGIKADDHALDVARVMRSSGTTNAKPGRTPAMVEIIEYNPDALYTLEELYTSLSGMAREDYYDAQAKAKKPKINKLQKGKTRKKSNYNLGKTNLDRVHDLEKLVEIRKDGFCEGCGYREMYLFVYAYFVQIVTRNIAKTLDRVRVLNDQFTDPLSDDELTTAVINTVEQGVKDRDIIILKGPWAGKHKGYNYKTETLIEKFGITPEEQKQLKTLCNSNIKNERHNAVNKANRRNENGLTNREQQKINNVYVAHCYHEQGKTVSEIADLMGVNKASISRYLDLDKPETSMVIAFTDKKIVVA